MKLAWIILVFICGALLPVQAGLNARLGRSLASPVYASLFSFIVGAVVMAIYSQLTRQSISWSGLRSASVYDWLGGGITGAIFITATMLALPRIGMALTSARKPCAVSKRYSVTREMPSSCAASPRRPR